jgi:5'-methylthioadenosine phosphorylase
MTNLQEAKLAREAEICYTTMALVTDYDCWHPDHDSVTVADIVANLQRNSLNAQALIKSAVKGMPESRGCGCGHALEHALLTDPAKIPAETKARLSLLVGKYL